MGARNDQSRLTALEKTAYHEAGHAVLTLALFGVGQGGVRHATIVPEEKKNTLGHTRHWTIRNFRPDRELTPRTCGLVADGVVVLLAGLSAERRVTGRRDYVGAYSHHEKAADLAMRVCTSVEEVNAYLKWLEIRTDNILMHWWPSVEAVARALLERHTLDGEQVQVIATPTG
jgi:ATP-dependent Zn protease